MAAELESLDPEEPDEGFGVDRGFPAAAKSIVARSSEVSEAGDVSDAPQDEQKRPFAGAGEPHEAQKAMFHKCIVFQLCPVTSVANAETWRQSLEFVYGGCWAEYFAGVCQRHATSGPSPTLQIVTATNLNEQGSNGIAGMV